MLRIITTLCMMLVLLTMVTACSSGGGPTLPDESDATAWMPVYVNPTPEGEFSGVGTLGVYHVSLDTERMSYEITPQRMSSFVPEVFECDLTTALMSIFCKDCFVINGMTLSAAGNVVLEVGLKHPFPAVSGLPSVKPERPDLHVFDVQGIVVIEGSRSFPLAGITLNPDFLVNADGYTTVFDTEIDSLGPAYTTTANCHPFRIMSMGDYVTPADEIGNFDAFSLNGYPNPSGIMNPSGFNVLKGGQGWSSDPLITQYELKPASTAVNFFFVLTCSYGQAGKRLGTELQKRDNPIYLLPAFSKPEAWNVDVEIQNNALADNDNTSTADVVVRAADWQDAYAASTPNPIFDPSLDQAVPRNTVFQASDINLIQLEIPGLLTSTIDSSTVTPSGDGSYLNPKTYVITVNNELFASEISGDEPQFWGLSAVRDDLYGTPNPKGGIDRDLGPTSQFSISDYTTYQVFGISIYPPNDPPTPVLTVNYPLGPPYNLTSGDTVDVDGLLSFDTGDDGIPGGTIVAYEWDFDYDPVTGIFAIPIDPEYWTDPDPTVAAVPPLWALNNPWPAPISKYVGMRVTDGSLGNAKETAYVEIILGANQPPVADLGVAFYTTDLLAPYTFYADECVTLKPGAGCYDDGAITTYQYDFSYVLASGFLVEAANTSGAPVLTPPQVIGPIDMGLRVQDNGIPNLSAMNIKTLSILDTAATVPVNVSDPLGTGIDTYSVGFHAIAESLNHILCAWTQDGSGSGSDIFYSVYNKVGMTWSLPAVLNGATLSTQSSVSLCANWTTDVFYAAYEDSSGGSQQITFAMSDPGGAVWQLLNQNTITSYVIGANPEDPSIAFAPAGPMIAVAYKVIDAGHQIRVETSPAGLVWTQHTINSSTTSDRTDPVICFNSGTNDFGVAWDDLRSGSGYEIYFNQADAALLTWPTDTLVATDTGSLNDPSLASDGLLWHMSFDNLVATSDVNYTTSPDGTTWSVPVDITDNTNDQHNNSGISVDGLGTIYITCRDSRETGLALQADIYVFKHDGISWVRGVKVNDRVGTENNLNTNILGLNAGGFLVMYNYETPGSHLVYTTFGNAY